MRVSDARSAPLTSPGVWNVGWAVTPQAGAAACQRVGRPFPSQGFVYRPTTCDGCTMGPKPLLLWASLFP